MITKVPIKLTKKDLGELYTTPIANIQTWNNYSNTKYNSLDMNFIRNIGRSRNIELKRMFGEPNGKFYSYEWKHIPTWYLEMNSVRFLVISKKGRGISFEVEVDTLHDEYIIISFIEELLKMFEGTKI